MSDNGSATSKSKKRRQRRKNRKLNDGQNDSGDANPSPSPDTKDDVVAESKHVEEIKVSYRVDSPVEKAKKTPKLSRLPVKSKSLDDDETVKIQELSETSETDEKDKDNKAIVSEASESETDKEEVADSKSTSKATLSSLSLTLEEYNPDENTLMSPEDEQKLRNFLEGLNLVSGPDEAAKHAYDKGNENVKGKKSQKRAALEQYFLPISQNPRFLDAISEEPSDRDSDREQPDLKQHLKRGTPETELPGKPPAPPPRNKSKRKNFATPIQQPPAVLVDAKIVDSPTVTEGYISTSKAAEATSVEIVYLDSTESSSPADYDTISNDSYALDSQKSTSNEEISKEEITINGISSSESDTISKSSEDISNTETEEKTSNILNVKEKTDRDSTRPNKVYPIYSNVIVSNAQINNNINEKYESVLQNKNAQSNFTIICKKDNGSQEKTYEQLSGGNETVTTSTSTKCSFVIKCDQSTNETDTKQRMIESGILSQLTPPPTPENMSPKNEANDLPCFVETDSSRIEEVIIDHGNAKSSIEKTDRLKQNTNSSEKNNETPDSVEVKQNISENKKSTETDSQKGTSMKNQTPNKEIIGYKKYSDKIKTPSMEEDAKKEIGIVYTNVISPPPPSRSPSISSSSSVDSSLCTAKYNPSNSSIADVTSIAKDEDLNKETTQFQPTTLREICLNFLLTLPFGADVLQELADVSESIESYTNNLPSKILPKLIPNLPAFVNKTESDSNNDSCKLSVKAMPIAKEWVGIPTEKDPKLLMCVSPKQKEELEKSKPVTDEAGKLIDLHEKFVNRRHQEEVKNETEEKITITNVSRNTSNVSVASPTGNRLLEIIREEPATIDENYIYFLEKEPADVSATLPRARNSESARLKAKNLSEWLNLARDKSMSESNLSSAADIPENNLRKDFNTRPTPKRRTSLPHDLFQRQMIYLQEREREIQRQLEQLEDEKRRLNAEIAPSRHFQPEDYRFSRKGDFAENKNPAARPTSMPAMPTEYFRQQMYEEYMDKFAEREDRKQNKVIKVTSSKDPNGDNTNTTNEVIRSKEIIHPIHIEKEFLEKVKQKQEQGKLGKNRESVGRESSLDKEKDEEEPVLVMDGDKLKGAKQLPKHLQEFVSIAKQVADGESECISCRKRYVTTVSVFFH